MSYDKQKIKEVFNNPEFQKLIEDKDWKALIEKEYFDNVEHKNNLASFIIQELGYNFLKEIDIIPIFCFCNDENIQGDFIIPSSIKSIYWGAFSSCNNLKNIIIPYSVESIGDFVFSSCAGLKSVTIQSKVIEIGSSAFVYCRNLKDVYYRGTREQFEDIVDPHRNDDLLNANFHQI